MPFARRATALALFVATLLSLLAGPARASDLVIVDHVRFSELDGGPADEDGIPDGVLTVSKMEVQGFAWLELDTPEAEIHCSGDFVLGGLAEIRNVDYPLPLTGPSLRMEVDGDLSLKGYSRIRSYGVMQGGTISLCTEGDLTMSLIAGIEASAFRFGSVGGTIELQARNKLHMASGFNFLEAHGFDGGRIRLTACSSAPDALVIGGTVGAIGILPPSRPSGVGGSISVEARQGGIRFLHQAYNLAATGYYAPGTIEVTAAKNVWPSPNVPALPATQATTWTPSEEWCGCKPPLTVEALALSDLQGPAPLSVVLSADTFGQVVLYEWDFDGDGTWDWSDTDSPTTSNTYTQAGEYQATIRVTDVSANTAQDTLDVVVEEGLSVSIQANPTSGERPLTVLFNPSAASSGPSVFGYRWDWDGDGTWDTGYYATPQPVYHTYSTAGDFDAALEVRDELGGTATAVQRISVRNPPPVVHVSVSPSNGPVPLDVDFTVTASSANGPIVSVDLDPGDGSPVIQASGPGMLPHTYSTEGQFVVTVTVVDSVGESATIQSPLVDVWVGPPGSPTAVATASPSSGTAPLLVNLSATGSTTPTGTLDLFEWDFDYDGAAFTPDFSSSTRGSTQHTYSVGGVHVAALRVTNSSGLTATDFVGVVVDVDVQLRIPDDTFDPHVGELATVETVLSADANVRVLVVDRAGNEIRTLFDGPRPLGTYQDTWNGTGASGNVLRDGDYYALVEYVIDGVTLVEPDSASGGVQAFVSQSQNLSNGQTFDPWNDEFWEMTFNTGLGSIGASEISLWITPFTQYEITTAIFENQVFGTGAYQAWWDGVKDDGTYVEDQAQAPGNGGDYLWSAQAFSLPDNTIVLQGGRPQITDPAADPNRFDPATLLCPGQDECEITFTLSHDAAVALQVYAMRTGRLLRVLNVPEMAAGTHAISWDGRAQSGDYVAGGPYRLELTATTRTGNTSFLRRCLVLVDY